MTYLIDTDWSADYLKGKPDAVSLLRSLRPQGLAISQINYAEIYEGIYYGKDRATNEAAFRQFLRVVTVLPLNRAILQRFGVIRGDLRSHGQLFGDFDLLIGTTALHHNLTVVTRNVKHYNRIHGILLYPTP